MMKIKSVRKGSIASRLSISPGDELVEISGHPVNDIIDYRFYSSDHHLRLKLRYASGRTKTLEVRKEPDGDLGVEFYPTKYKSCNNNCIFCFVHQLPKGLRKALYFKDEDFRLSFLHGNFISLTNTSDEEIERIVRQRLSPLYVSVHVTDEQLRKRIFGNPRIPDIMPLIRKLAKGRIELHAQIVLCPNVNDGEYLKKSVDDLCGLYPGVKSLALVPVGLTRFREKLPRIRAVNRTYCKKTIELVNAWQKSFRRRWGKGFVYAADEFFTKAEVDIPAKTYYDDFYQVENGVGMMRMFLDALRSQRKLLPKRLKRDLTVTLVTGLSAFRLIKGMVEENLSRIPGLKIQLVVVKNDFLGRSVTVSGLLTGTDILNALGKHKNPGDVVLLPPNCVNEEGSFLDDLSPLDIGKALGRRVVVGSYHLVETLTRLFGNL